MRRATERGKLSDLPNGATAPGPETSNWRIAASVWIAAATPCPPASATAAAAAREASSTGDSAA